MSRDRPEPITVTHIISGDLWAGAEVQVYNLCKGLLASHEVVPTAVVFNEGFLSDRLRALGMEVDVASEKELSAVQIVFAIARHCRKHGSQVVHTHGFKENILGILGKDIAGVPRSVRTVHGNPETNFAPTQLHKRITHYLDTLLGRLRQRHVIAVSSQLEERLQPLFPGKVKKIFNFVDVEAIQRSKTLKADTGSHPFKLGIVGRLVAVKRVDLFLETVALLNKKGIDCTGVIIGTGPLEPALKKLAKDLEIDHLVEFRGFRDPVHDELQQLDALIMPSDHEGLPMTLLEALALEIPIIAHDTGGIPEILKAGECGWIVCDHSANGYAEKTLEVTQCSLKKRSEKSQRGLEHVRTYFGMKENMHRYLNIYCTTSKEQGSL
ncbi:glycosyltransferase involved in cell wall biosynthesis [Marinobacter sp. 3-2]|jgi:glycosyltransferase involved in cell wall biosynthesis|uniref:glycosyltransferase n=1 Tax=Marinobacter sp. 3-2 TaxID=2485141 RepID=UPI000D34B4AA|nr:glycosyltransferase [Marinobacter sp. 3-2]ROQ42897.1 glycosyltransferase involved in cell wall biosynthesis [Marinobacter sp. 3-2]